MISWRTALWGNTEEVRFLLSGEDKAQGGPLLRFQYLKGQLKRGQRLSLHNEPQGEDKGKWVKVATGEVSPKHKFL